MLHLPRRVRKAPPRSKKLPDSMPWRPWRAPRARPRSMALSTLSPPAPSAPPGANSSPKPRKNRPTLEVEETDLRWNDAVFPANPQVRQLHRVLRERMVARITFTGKLHTSDLARLLQLLAEDPQLLLSSGGLMQAFGPGNSRGPLFRDMDFAHDLKDCEAAWVEECRKVHPMP